MDLNSMLSKDVPDEIRNLVREREDAINHVAYLTTMINGRLKELKKSPTIKRPAIAAPVVRQPIKYRRSEGSQPQPQSNDWRNPNRQNRDAYQHDNVYPTSGAGGEIRPPDQNQYPLDPQPRATAIMNPQAYPNYPSQASGYQPLPSGPVPCSQPSCHYNQPPPPGYQSGPVPCVQPSYHHTTSSQSLQLGNSAGNNIQQQQQQQYHEDNR